MRHHVRVAATAAARRAVWRRGCRGSGGSVEPAGKPTAWPASAAASSDRQRWRRRYDGQCSCAGR
eukprot:4665249-Prymnesium_polylepis.1